MSIWVEIFKTGKHTSSDGTTNEYSESDLENAIKNFPGKIPVIIGHSKPNYELANIEQLKKANGTLFGLLSEENIDKFSTVAKSGLNRISAGFKDIKNMVLDHVALLGATPGPAIKDLTPIKFNEKSDDFISIDLLFNNKGVFMPNETEISGMLEKTENNLIKKMKEFFSKSEKEEPGATNSAKFSADEIKKLIDSSAEEMKKEFQVELDALKKENTELKNSLGNSFNESREKEFSSFLDSKEMEKKITPAIKTHALRLFNALDSGSEIQFQENDKEVKSTPLSEFKAILKLIPDQITFEEFATDGIGGSSNLEDVEKLVEKFNERNG